MFFKAHFSALQHGKRKTTDQKKFTQKLYRAYISVILPRPSQLGSREALEEMIVAIIPSRPSLAINSPYTYNNILNNSLNKPKPG